MRSIFLQLTLAVALVAGCAEPIPDPPAAERNPDPSAAESNRGPLACGLRGEPTCEVGTEPKLTVTLVNQTGAAIYLVGCLDGSGLKGRYPHCYFEVTGPDGQLVEYEPRRRCANQNPLRWADFIEVLAGETFDPFKTGFWAGPSGRLFSVPGKYRIRFVYSTRHEDIRAWSGDDPWDDVPNEDTFIALFGRVPKVVVRSNDFEVTVLAPAK